MSVPPASADGTGETGRLGGHDVVRPYMMTGGRTRAARRDLRLETVLATMPDVDPHDRSLGLTAEQAALLQCCQHPMALAEASATLGLVVGVTAILASDLVADGVLEVHQTNPVEIELDMLNRMIDAVRTL